VRLSTFNLQPSNYFYALVLEHFFLVRRVGEFAGEVLRGEVQLLVQVAAPFGAIGHIVDKATVGDPFAGAALTRVATEFDESDGAVGNIHATNYIVCCVNN
jgi:hypothetical protein